jgi:hypothetical protein
MDKSWMNKSRISREYFNGVQEFVTYASKQATDDGMILCPCVKCVNSTFLDIEVVRLHLESFGICKGYQPWDFHGESSFPMASSKTRDSHVQESSNEYGDIHEMLHDLFPMQNMTSGPVEEGPSVRQHAQGPNEDAQRFYNLLKDAEQSLYEGCKNFSKLSAIVHLYHLKCISGWTNKSFTMLLQLLQDLLPLDAKLPKNCYEAKKITNKLGLGYKNIHACPNDCMLFWKEKVLDESCSECGASRWAESKSDLSEDHFDADDDDDDEMEHNMNDSSNKRKKKAAKILRWFPLKPRLQRLFMSSKTATHMKWHADGRTDDGLMRHPADSPAWKTFDSKYDEFSSEPHNVILGLATDGFNPFELMSISHST